MPLVAVFHHQNLKHPRQADDRRRRQKDQPDPAIRLNNPVGIGKGLDPVNDRRRPTCQPPDHEHPHRQQGHQFDHRLDSNRGDNPVVLLFGIQIAGAEQDGEQRQPRRHPDSRNLAVRQRPPLGRV